MIDTMIEITDKEYELIVSFVYNNIGINLTGEKRNLVVGRCQKILRAFKFKSFTQYYEYLISDKTGHALSELANTISTNHTYFWREHDHFEYFLKTDLPEIESRLKKHNSRDLRIWCAGCSTGEEPYILVMLMMEHFGTNYKNLDAGILATDISERALITAKTGIYSQDRVKNLPEIYRKKYFRHLPDGNYEIKDEVKNEVTFRRFNLMNEVFPFKKQFETIFCRNVMIYFDNETRETLVKKFYNLTVPGGYLYIGHSETLNRQKDLRYSYIKPALYRKE